MQKLAKFLFYRIWGWKLLGSFPDLKKCVVIVVPHTSWVDFVLGLLVREVIGVNIHYVGKKSLFKPPYGWFFRWMGGAPIDRSRSRDTVSAIARIFNEKDEFRLALSPEGTRRKVTEWRSGFYYIAKAAGVPIILVAFDFGRKQVKISEPMFPTADRETDFETYRRFFKGVLGRVPENSF